MSDNLVSDLQAINPDVIFNALHGQGGEDGIIQGLFEVLKIPYTHSNVLASALAMDKVKAKKIFASYGLTVAEDRLIEAKPLTDHPMLPPYVVKPVTGGSSVEVMIVERGDPPVGVSYTLPVMVETYIPGREFTCCVIDNQPSAVMEVLPKEGFYDYKAKYDMGGSDHILPADIPQGLCDEIRRQTLVAHECLGCSGVTRTDFKFDGSINGYGLVILELNTQPGMTEFSLVPEMAAYQGFSYQDFVRWMVEDALCRY